MELAVLEIDKSGMVLSISCPSLSKLDEVLPEKGGIFSKKWDSKTNEKLNNFISSVFNSSLPLELEINLDNVCVQLIGHHHNELNALIYVKQLPSNTTQTLLTSTKKGKGNPYPNQLNKSEEATLKRFTDNLPLVIFEVHIYEDGTFKFGFVNEEMHSFFPEFNRDIINADNEKLFIRVHPEDKERLLQSIKDGLEFKTLDIEYRIIDNDEIKWVRGYGRPEPGFNGSKVTLCAYIQDITKQKKAERAVSKERSMLRTLIDNLPVSIFVKDAQGRKLMANRLDVEFMEVASEKDAIGKTDIEIYKNPQKEYGYYEDIKVIHGKVPIIDQHGYVMKNNGEMIDILVSKVPIFDDLGNVIGLIGICRDVTEKLRIEEQLKLIDFSFRNAATSIIYIREDASLFDFNNSFCDLLGYSRDEMKALKIFDFDPEFNAEIWPSHWQELRTAGRLSFITQKKKKDGGIIDVEVSANLIKFGELELNCAFITDTTERKKVEEELKKSNKRYEYATIATSDAIWEADLVNNTMFLSSNYQNISGYENYNYQDLENNDWAKNVHPDDLQRIMQNGDDIIECRIDKFQNEYRLKKSDGEYITVLDRGFPIKNDEGKVISLIGSIQDITQKKTEEERLKLWETVITNTSEAIIIRDAKPMENGGLPVLFVNKAFTQMTGYTSEEITGKTLGILNGPLTDRDERNKIREAINQKQPGKMRVINYKKNGETFWASVSVFPLKNIDGETTHWVSIQRDITKRIIADAEREQLLNELMQNNKELKQFSYITTHNLRAPLTNLQSIAKIIKTDKIDDQRTIALIEGFKKSTNHLSETLDDLIEILIIKENQHLPMKEVGFDEVLQNVKASIANSILETKTEIESDFSLIPSVHFNGAYMESIFLNLITNAIRYAHPDRHPIIQIISTVDKEGKTKLIFSDNGLGMDFERVKDRIFGLYQRFHNIANSKGIGLYLVHSQITSLGGNIEVASAVNIGTTFTITF